MRENEPETHENSWIHEQKLVRCIEGFHFQSQRDWMTGKRRWCPSPRNHACTWARAEKLKEQIQQELEKLWVQVLLHITWVSQWILDGVCELSLCLYPATCPKLQSIKKKGCTSLLPSRYCTQCHLWAVLIWNYAGKRCWKATTVLS